MLSLLVNNSSGYRIHIKHNILNDALFLSFFLVYYHYNSGKFADHEKQLSMIF